MTIQELRDLVARGESECLEFKRSTGSLNEGVKSVCAMLNGTRPGHILFGVKDSGEIVGQDVAPRTLEDVANELRKIEPSAFPSVEIVPLESGREVIVLHVSGGTGLYGYDGRAYYRLDPTTSVMPRDLYAQRLMEQMRAPERWENWPAEGFTIQDLDEREIIRTIEEAIRRQRMDDPGTRDSGELLLGMGLIEGGRIVNAAVVLFGRPDRMLGRFTQCLIRLARFRGTTKTEFIDNRQEIGNAFDIYVRAQRFLRDHLPIAGRVVPNLFERIDDPLYPPEALREAIVNALCHRDYSSGGGSLGIAIFDDRLEIISPGGLPFGLTPEDLRRPHPSRLRNPLIAHAFYRRGIIEQWGRGTIRMIELTEQAGLTAPEFESTPYEVTVRFRPTRYVAPRQVSRLISPLQRELFEILADSQLASLKLHMDRLSESTPRRTIQDNLQELRMLGLVDTSGKGIGARWFLTNSAFPEK